MPGVVTLSNVSATVDLGRALAGTGRLRVSSCDVALTRGAINAALKTALREHESLTITVEEITEGVVILKGRYGIGRFGGEVHLRLTSAGCVHVDLEGFSAMGLPVGQIRILREKLADQLRQTIPVMPGLTRGRGGERLVTVDPRVLAKAYMLDLPPIETLQAHGDAIEIHFAGRTQSV